MLHGSKANAAAELMLRELHNMTIQHAIVPEAWIQNKKIKMGI